MVEINISGRMGQNRYHDRAEDLWQLKSEVPLIWNIYGYFQEFSLGPTDLFKKNPENSYKNSILRVLILAATDLEVLILPTG
jgi:hypothetical protein